MSTAQGEASPLVIVIVGLSVVNYDCCTNVRILLGDLLGVYLYAL